MSKYDMKIYVNAKLYCTGPTIIAVLVQIQNKRGLTRIELNIIDIEMDRVINL